MTPEQRSAYDAYVPWMVEVVGLGDALAFLPLEELLAANMRMQLVGGYVADGTMEQVSPVALARQRALIERLMAARDAYSVSDGSGS